MACILAVGIATLDIINTVTDYPVEDSEVRACAQRKVRGGNATNTLTVLKQLGHECHWAGVLVETPDSRFIMEDLAANEIDTSCCQRLTGGQMPTSYITLSAANGSRSIVHYRDLPEFDFAHFQAIDLTSFDWLHFEGRNPAETARMLAHAKAVVPHIPCSVEVEKPRDDMELLFENVDLLLFSRPFAEARGATSAEGFLEQSPLPVKDCVISWGEQGVWVRTSTGEIYHAPALVLPEVVDTLGAGDTFNAAIIDAQLRGLDWPVSLVRGCELAGKKCTQQGLMGLVND